MKVKVVKSLPSLNPNYTDAIYVTYARKKVDILTMSKPLKTA